MLSQQTKTLLVLLVAIYLGYLYTTRGSGNSETEITFTGNIPHVSLNQISNIQYNQNMEKKLKAFVLGATGAVGKELVKALGADARFEKVVLIGRREVPLNPGENPDHAKIENKLIDYEKLEEHKDAFKGFDVGFCALGTTRKKSGAEGFYRVDHDYVVGSAKLAKEAGLQHFHLVSSAGANKNAYFLYPKTKGEVEAELAEMDFPRLSIYRPAVLLVSEPREESRAAEALMRGLLKPLDKARWFSMDVPMLSKVMVANCFRESPSKSEILDNTTLNKFAKELLAGNTPPPPTSAQDGKTNDTAAN